MTVLPYIDENMNTTAGDVFELSPKCKRMCAKCSEFYKSIFNSGTLHQFIRCPMGYSVFLDQVNNKKIAFQCLKVKGSFKKKNSLFQTAYYNPITSEEILLKIIESCKKSIELKNELKVKEDLTATTFHEIKKFNAQIKNHCEAIFSKIDSCDQFMDKNIINNLNDIWICAGMMSYRFALNDLYALTAETPFDVNIYGKFDKIRKILKNNKKNLPIKINGKSYKYIRAYQSFEIIPFLLLDNAIKYSHPNDEIIIEFYDQNNNKDPLLVSITSDGPYCDTNEIQHIFEKGYRGTYAKKIVAEGSGIGLYFAKCLAQLHDIDISAHSIGPQKVLNGVAYARFMIQLSFNSTFDKS